LHEPATHHVADAVEAAEHGVGGLGEVDGHAEGALDPGLGEKAEKVVGREGVCVWGGDVVEGPARGGGVRILDVAAGDWVRGGQKEGLRDLQAGFVGHGTCVVDLAVTALVGGVELGGEASTFEDLVATAAGGRPIGHGGVEEIFRDGLQVVGVVVSHHGVRKFCREGINAAVYNAEGVEVNDKGMGHVGERAIEDLLVLFLKEGGHGRAVLAAIAFRPNGDAVVVGLVVREFGKEVLGEVPKGACSILSAVGGEGCLVGWEASQEKSIILLWYWPIFREWPHSSS